MKMIVDYNGEDRRKLSPMSGMLIGGGVSLMLWGFILLAIFG